MARSFRYNPDDEYGDRRNFRKQRKEARQQEKLARRQARDRVDVEKKWMDTENS